MIRVDPSESRPLWSQIEEQVRWLAASGEIPPAGPIPSVRELAKTLRVNPATVAKAYRRLVRDGILVVRRGEGTFLAPKPPAMTAAARRRQLDEAATRFVASATIAGTDRDEAIRAVSAAWDRTSREREGIPA